MKKQPLWTKDFLSISFTSFFLFIGFYILLTVMPLYILDELNGNESQAGLIIATFLIAAVLCRPFTGKIIDEVGRKKFLLISVSIYFLSSILYLFFDNFTSLLFIRFLHGIGFGMATTTAGAIVADLIPSNRRGEGLGYFTMFTNLAMVIGPFTGLTIIQYVNFKAIFILCAVLAICTFFLSLIVKVPNSVQRKVEKQPLALSQFFEKKAIPVSITVGILAFVYSGILSFISLYAKERGLVEAASFFFIVYAVAILVSRPFTGKWFDLYGENRVIYPSIVLYAIGMFVLSQAESSFVFLLSGAIIGLGFGTLSSSLQTVALQNADPTKRGLATSTYFTFYDTGIGIGSYVLALLASHVGFTTVYLYLSIIILIAGIQYLFFYGKKATKQSHAQSRTQTNH
jgi:MFS family permease